MEIPITKNRHPKIMRKWKGKELEKAKGKDARREAHDKKTGRGDRSREELDEDYEE